MWYSRDSDFGPYLVWESNFDGELNAYLDQLLHNAPGVDQIFSCCAGYAPAKHKDYILTILSVNLTTTPLIDETTTTDEKLGETDETKKEREFRS